MSEASVAAPPRIGDVTVVLSIVDENRIALDEVKIILQTNSRIVIVEPQKGTPIQNRTFKIGLTAGVQTLEIKIAKRGFNLSHLDLDANLKTREKNITTLPEAVEETTLFVPGECSKTIHNIQPGQKSLVTFVLDSGGEVEVLSGSIAATKSLRRVKKDPTSIGPLDDMELQPPPQGDTVLIMGGNPLVFKAKVKRREGLQRPVEVFWDFTKKEGEKEPLPSFTSKGRSSNGDSLAELTPNSFGSVKLSAKLGRSLREWNITIVRVRVTSAQSEAQSSPKNFKLGSKINIDADLPVPFLRTENSAFCLIESGKFSEKEATWIARVSVELHGGSQSTVPLGGGVDKARLFYIQNQTHGTHTAMYGQDFIRRDFIQAPFPVLDVTPRVSSEVLRDRENRNPIFKDMPRFQSEGKQQLVINFGEGQFKISPNQVDRIRTVEMRDAPSQVYFSVQRTVTLSRVIGVEKFLAGLAVVSSDARNAIVIVATTEWELPYSGTVELNIIGNRTFTPDAVCKAGPWRIDGKGGQDARLAGFEIDRPIALTFASEDDGGMTMRQRWQVE